MGLVVARIIGDLIKSGLFVIGFSIFMLVFNALVEIFTVKAIGIPNLPRNYQSHLGLIRSNTI